MANIGICIVNMSGIVKVMLVLYLYLSLRYFLRPNALLEHSRAMKALILYSEGEVKAVFNSGKIFSIQVTLIQRFLPELIKYSVRDEHKGASRYVRTSWLFVWPDSLPPEEYRLFKMRLNLEAIA